MIDESNPKIVAFRDDCATWLEACSADRADREESGFYFMGSEFAKEAADKLTETLQEFNEKVRSDPNLHQIVNGQIAWTPERAQAISDFKNDMSSVLNSAIDPDLLESSDKNFWSKDGKVAALAEGTALENTIMGEFFERMNDRVNETFFEGAYRGDDKATAGAIGVWNAISENYTEETGVGKDAHVYLTDGMTDNQSVFMNTELPKLREMQDNGLVDQIYLHQLKPEAQEEYREAKDHMVTAKNDMLKTQTLIQQGKQEGMPDNSLLDAKLKEHEQRFQYESQRMHGVLTDKSNWSQEVLDKNSSLKINTAGFTGDRDKQQISAKRVVELASKWKENAKAQAEAREQNEPTIGDKPPEGPPDMDRLEALIEAKTAEAPTPSGGSETDEVDPDGPQAEWGFNGEYDDNGQPFGFGEGFDAEQDEEEGDTESGPKLT